MVEYKETLNLPQTTLEMRANATRNSKILGGNKSL